MISKAARARASTKRCSSITSLLKVAPSTLYAFLALSSPSQLAVVSKKPLSVLKNFMILGFDKISGKISKSVQNLEKLSKLMSMVFRSA